MKKDLMKSLFKKDSTWFFTDTYWPWKLLLIYVNGDLLVLLPFLILVLALGFFSVKWMLVTASLFCACRFLGEMMYWLLQQFGPRTYRPYDWGFRQLDTNAIYVLYQLWSLVGLVVSVVAGVYVLTVF